MKEFIIKDTEGANLYKTEARSFKQAVLEALKSLGNLAGANLAGAYLAGAYLEGADLVGANLIGANLAGADLSFEPVEIPADEAEETTATPSLSELESKIILWAKDKGITSKDNAKNQFLKTVEEVGELASALAKNDLEEVKDSVGDIIVTLIILAEIKGFSATEALSNVYDIIRKRTGKTVGGVFVKDE